MKRPPDLVIGPPDKPYLRRWDLLKFLGWQVSLHEMLADDDVRAMHDHPSFNVSIVLRAAATSSTRISTPKAFGSGPDQSSFAAPPCCTGLS
jgi:hypothetical protein